MNNWRQQFIDDYIFFITPDVKRGLGFAGILPKYHIICSDKDPIIPIVRTQGANIFCLEENWIKNLSQVRNSGKILEMPQVLEYIKTRSSSTPKIMYFKPSLKLDYLIGKNGFIPIGNSADINDLFEDKIKFSVFAQNNGLNDYLVPFSLGILGEMNYEGLVKELASPIIVQFGHGWAGKTTFFIKDKIDFDKLAGKFPHTRVRAVKYIKGFTVLNNCCIYKENVLVGLPAIQIDGVSLLSDKPMVTCGRQWPAKFISQNQVSEIKKISVKVGTAMAKSGFGGFFGLDFLVSAASGKIYLSEVNARMTASSAFYSLLELKTDKTPLLAYHMAHFLDKELPEEEYELDEMIGSQIIIRRPMEKRAIFESEFGVYKYEESKILLSRKDYHPDKLSEDEFIFIGRKIVDNDNPEEYARIETKNEVLERPSNLKDWVQNLLK